MNYSDFTVRVGGDGVAAWDLHERACIDFSSGKDVIVLSVGDPDFDTPKAIVNQAIESMQNGDTHYQPVMGRTELRQLIAEQYQPTCPTRLGAENVMMFAGAQNALFASSLCLLNPGDDVLVLDPMYVTYEAALRASGANLVSVPQPADSGFRLDSKALKKSVTSKTKAIVVTNPNNPTGVVMSREDLEQISELAIENDLWVISDEVYSELVFDGDFHNIANLPGMFERTITLNSLSKSYAMTGWRVGWGIGPKELILHFSNLALCMLYGLSGFTQSAAFEALKNQKSESNKIRNIFLKRRNLAYEELNRIPGLVALKPQAGMFIMLDVRGLGLGSLEFANQLYEETGVSVLDAGAFGKSSQGWVRISFTLSDEKLLEACQRIGQFVKQFHMKKHA